MSSTHLSKSPSQFETDLQGSQSLVDVSVIIVNYNVKEFLKQVLNSIEKATQDLSVEVIVVDNDSVDGSVEMVEQFFPEVRLFASKENLGFGKANNLGICAAKGKYLFILNPDTVLQEDSIVKLTEFLDEHSEAGGVGPRIMDPDGTFARESRRSFPSPFVAFNRVIGLSKLFPKSKIFGRYNLTYLPIDQMCEVDALSGSCMMIRRHALLHPYSESWDVENGRSSSRSKLSIRDQFEKGGGGGLFDEAFFMYGEDLDWCFRIKKAGWKIFYSPSTQIIHYKGESTKRGELRYVKMFYGAMIQFVDKHFDGRHSRLFALIVNFGIFLRAGQSIIARGLQRLRLPFAEWLIASVSIALIAALRSLPVTFSFPAYFYYLVVPLFALSIVVAIAALNGYSNLGKRKTSAAFVGVGMAFLFVASLSFFAKGIAFSRLVVLFGFGLAGALIAAFRWVRKELSERSIGKRQAVLIGGREEALRLDDILRSHPERPFDLMGYVESDANQLAEKRAVQILPRLGELSQLRDIIRVRYIDDIVFSADDVSNQKILATIREINDLSVECKILSSGAEHVIGKSFIGSVEPFDELVGAEERVAEPRSVLLRRLIDIPFGILGLVLHLLLAPIRLFSSPSSFFSRLGLLTKSSLDMILGRKTFVGLHSEENMSLAEAWGLSEGVVPIVPWGLEMSEEERKQAYWNYVETQSLGLDLRITWDRIKKSGLKAENDD